MKWVKALFVKGVSIFLQLIAATAKCTGNQIKDVISTSAGTNGGKIGPPCLFIKHGDQSLYHGSQKRDW